MARGGTPGVEYVLSSTSGEPHPSAIYCRHSNPMFGFQGIRQRLAGRGADLLHTTTAAIAAFAQLDQVTAISALRAEADYDQGRDRFIDQYIADHGGDHVDDARYDALHAQAQETPVFEAFCHALRAELIEYFGVTEEQLDLAVILRRDDSRELWEAVNKQRAALGTGEVRGDL